MHTNWPEIFRYILIHSDTCTFTSNKLGEGELEGKAKKPANHISVFLLSSLSFLWVVMGFLSLTHCKCSSSWRMRSRSRLFISTCPGMSLKVGRTFLRGTVWMRDSWVASPFQHMWKTSKHISSQVLFLYRKGTKPEILCNVTKNI